MSLEISCVSLRLGFSNFWPRGLGVSDFCFLANGFDQNNKTFKSRSRNFKQGSRHLDESRILPFATPKAVISLLAPPSLIWYLCVGSSRGDRPPYSI